MSKGYSFLIWKLVNSLVGFPSPNIHSIPISTRKLSVNVYLRLFSLFLSLSLSLLQPTRSTSGSRGTNRRTTSSSWCCATRTATICSWVHGEWDRFYERIIHSTFTSTPRCIGRAQWGERMAHHTHTHVYDDARGVLMGCKRSSPACGRYRFSSIESKRGTMFNLWVWNRRLSLISFGGWGLRWNDERRTFALCCWSFLSVGQFINLYGLIWFYMCHLDKSQQFITVKQLWG